MSGMIIETANNKWEVICGLEIHCQIISKSKMFSGASTEFGADANEHVSFVDAGMPGMLPTLNKMCVRQAVKTGMGLNAAINKYSEFSRKNYNILRETGKISKTRINLMTVYESKGLEFTAVAVADSDMTDNEKYIAYTRALKELAVIR